MDKSIAKPKETVEGYEIEQEYNFKDNTGVALAVNSSFFNPYITCQYTVGENGTRDYYWIHHFLCENNARRGFIDRIDDRMREFGGKKHKYHRYYSVRNRIHYNTFPKPYGDPPNIICFDSPALVEKGRFKAWGYIEYYAPLSKKEIKDYGLRAAPGNPPVLKNQENAIPNLSHREHER